MRTFGRIAVAAAASLALALAPMGIASAGSATAAPTDYRDDDRRDDDRVSFTIPDTARPAVLAARSAYLTTAAGIRTTYRITVEDILDKARATTASADLAYEIAKDAYVVTRATGGDATSVATAKAALDNAATAYKAARQTARTASKPALDAAKATARSALESARTVYVTAVKNAVPNAPAALLVPPGRGKSWISQGFGRDFGLRWDRSSWR